MERRGEEGKGRSGEGRGRGGEGRGEMDVQWDNTISVRKNSTTYVQKCFIHTCAHARTHVRTRMQSHNTDACLKVVSVLL